MLLRSELVYGGRILKTGKTVTEYKVVPGCTIFVMAIKPKKRELAMLNLTRLAVCLHCNNRQ